jgi:AraC-like DNA-binding protein
MEGVGAAIQYIEDHITDELTADMIANHVNISSFYFQKGFAMLCGFTISEYIRNRRLALAANDLATGDGRIIDIAMKYGYDSPDSFTKAFSRFHGETSPCPLALSRKVVNKEWRKFMSDYNNELTLKYYNDNADQFYYDTVNVTFSKIQENFLKYLPDRGYILDFGCGSGRDSKAFMEKGYKVDAVDGSEEMCKLAEKLLNQKVQCIRFEDFEADNKYDGIWACASILHLDINGLKNVIIKLRDALKPKGHLYTSFKLGEFSGFKNGRYFTYMTRDSIDSLIKSVGRFDIIEMKINVDARPGRDDEEWINIILRKR